MQPMLARFAEPIYAIVRIIVGLLFASHGSQALLNFPPGERHELSTFLLVGKLIELVGGLLIASGLATSIAAFICSGQMAVAYWMFHAPRGPWPTMNDGTPAVLYCFLFLLMAAQGSGIWSLDSLLFRRPKAGAAPGPGAAMR